MQTMIGQTWQSEVSSFEDEKTGRTIKTDFRWQQRASLLTENSFDAHRNEIIFPAPTGPLVRTKRRTTICCTTCFGWTSATGEIVQLTDERSPIGNVTKTPDSRIVVYSAGKMRKLDTESGEVSTLYEEDGQVQIGGPPSAPTGATSPLPQRGGRRASRAEPCRLQDHYYLVKDGRVTLAYLDEAGQGGRLVRRLQGYPLAEPLSVLSR
jgi:hypothetical protein